MINERAVKKIGGPLEPYAGGMGEELARRGYSPTAAARHLRLLADLSRWLVGEGLEVGELTTEAQERFLRERRGSGTSRLVTRTGLSPLVMYLGRLGVLPRADEPGTLSAEEELLERFRSYLLRERAVIEVVAGQYTKVARLFLESCRHEGGAPNLAGLAPADVSSFVVRECPQRGCSSAKQLVAALRSFLGFLHVQGQVSAPLAQAIPAVADWRGASLPRALGAEQVKRLLASCDTRTPTGRRDYAVLVLLACLGLRSSEVVTLRLEDIDWRAGQVLVRGKGRTREKLPLPSDVGEALAAYLHSGRPRHADDRTVFLRSIAPIEALRPHAVTSVVRRACERAGLLPVGAHRLRHTAATETSCCLQAGASLSEVAQLLRQRDISTTSIYAKVDHHALGTLARPWPAQTEP